MPKDDNDPCGHLFVQKTYKSCINSFCSWHIHPVHLAVIFKPHQSLLIDQQTCFMIGHSHLCNRNAMEMYSCNFLVHFESRTSRYQRPRNSTKTSPTRCEKQFAHSPESLQDLMRRQRKMVAWKRIIAKKSHEWLHQRLHSFFWNQFKLMLILELWKRVNTKWKRSNG